MSTIEQIEHFSRLATAAGYEVRHEYFGGTGGGVCEVAGRKILFLDLGLSSLDQLEKLNQIFSTEPVLAQANLSQVARKPAA